MDFTNYIRLHFSEDDRFVFELVIAIIIFVVSSFKLRQSAGKKDRNNALTDVGEGSIFKWISYSLQTWFWGLVSIFLFFLLITMFVSMKPPI